MSACKSGKTRYPDERTAKIVLVGARARRAFNPSTRRQESRVYRCQLCSGWHLTSRAYRPPGTREGD